MAILDTIMGPLLTMHPFLAILLISFILSLVITLAYKFLTNQSLMKDLRTEQNELQKKLKELKNHPEKAMKVQSDMMEINMKYMTHSMRPTLFTFIPIILIFGWLNSHMGYYPLQPGEPFSIDLELKKENTGMVEIAVPEGMELINSQPQQQLVDAKTRWYAQGPAGEYNLTFKFLGKEASKKVLITEERKYIEPVAKLSKPFESVKIGNEVVRPLEGIPVLESLNWLWTYIILSLVFSMTFRRLMKLY